MKSRFNSFIDALERVGKSPCERYGCSERAGCSAREAACDAFAWWVNTGQLVPPHALRDGKLMTRDGKVLVWNERIVATPEKLAALLREGLH